MTPLCFGIILAVSINQEKERDMATTETVRKSDGKVGTTQDFADKDGTRTEIGLELVLDRAELLVENNAGRTDATWATASLSRDELWDHVHNCLALLYQMPEEGK